MTRLENKFAELRAAKRKGLVIYITAGAPDIETTIEAVKAAERAGADIIELGIPFSDPMADGPVIQLASYRAIQAGMTTKKALELVKKLREFTDIPILGMGYVNNILAYGVEEYIADAKAAGMDGAIIPDVPHEESGELREACGKHDFHVIEFVTPGTTPARVKETCMSANGFIYCVSVNGVTGVRKIDYTPIGKVAQMVSGLTDVPLAVGFGIGSPEAAVDAAQHADAVIVGSAVVKLILDSKLEEAAALIASLRQALDAAYGK